MLEKIYALKSTGRSLTELTENFSDDQLCEMLCDKLVSRCLGYSEINELLLVIAKRLRKLKNAAQSSTESRIDNLKDAAFYLVDALPPAEYTKILRDQTVEREIRDAAFEALTKKLLDSRREVCIPAAAELIHAEDLLVAFQTHFKKTSSGYEDCLVNISENLAYSEYLQKKFIEAFKDEQFTFAQWVPLKSFRNFVTLVSEIAQLNASLQVEPTFPITFGRSLSIFDKKIVTQLGKKFEKDASLIELFNGKDVAGFVFGKFLGEFMLNKHVIRNAQFKVLSPRPKVKDLAKKSYFGDFGNILAGIYSVVLFEKFPLRFQHFFVENPVFSYYLITSGAPMPKNRVEDFYNAFIAQKLDGKKILLKAAKERLQRCGKKLHLPHSVAWKILNMGKEGKSKPRIL